MPTALQGNASLRRLTRRESDAIGTANGDRNGVAGADSLPHRRE
jgi:hypothetical protein